MSRRKSPRGRQYAREQADLADALKSAPGLSAFTFDGPWPVTGAHDLLDSMYCADNGRYYETPISWYGLARQFGYASWHQSALFFKRNVLAGCFIPHKLLSRQAFSSFALDWFVFGNAYLEMRRNRLHGPLGFRNGARPADGFWRGMPTPSLPPKRALAPPPRLRAKHASFCALCATG